MTYYPQYARRRDPTDPWDKNSSTEAGSWVRVPENQAFPEVSDLPPANGYEPPPANELPPNCNFTDPGEGVATKVRRRFFVGGHVEDPIELDVMVNAQDEATGFITLGARGYRAYVKWGKTPGGNWCKVKSFGSMNGRDWQQVYAADLNDPSDSGSGLTATYKAQDANVDLNIGNQVLEINRFQNISASNSLSNSDKPLEQELTFFVETTQEPLSEAEKQIPVAIKITPVTDRYSQTLGAQFTFPGSMYRIAYERLYNLDKSGSDTDITEDDIVYIGGCPYAPITIYQISPFRQEE